LPTMTTLDNSPSYVLYSCCMAWDETEVLSFTAFWAVLAYLHREGRGGGGPASAVHVQNPARKPAPITHAIDITRLRLCRGNGGMGRMGRMGRMVDRGGGMPFCEASQGCRRGWTALPEGEGGMRG
jgi:hypothetical protein